MNLVEKEIIINVPWGKIAVLTWGNSSNPPALLCHGKMDVSSGFRSLVSLLPKSFYYVSMDLPGNGHWDRLPKGGRYTVLDFVPTIAKIKDHFKWEKFIYIGHSLGALIGTYPISRRTPAASPVWSSWTPYRTVELWESASFPNWYHLFYSKFYHEDKYGKLNASTDTAPRYSYEKAMDLVITTRGLTPDAAKLVLERSLAPAGDGLYRFTFDQRLREVPRMLMSRDYMEELYTTTRTPIFALLSKNKVNTGAYNSVPFMRNIDAWPNKNYRVKVEEGGHDFHINTPESISEDIAKFLIEDVKAKL